MIDLVDRLRDFSDEYDTRYRVRLAMEEAADELARLRAHNERLEAQLASHKRVIAEREQTIDILRSENDQPRKAPGI